MNSTLLEFKNIEKDFFGVSVLKEVSFRIAAGTTLGLVGENGAGKSTLMNILGGNLAPSAGEMFVNSLPFLPRSPRDAERAGIAFVHQELNLFRNLSIVENLFLTRFPRKFARIDRRSMHKHAVGILRRVGIELSPNTLVEHLSTGERQLVEIAKALNSNAKLLILDEPTTSLTSRETTRLFSLMQSLQQQGIAMIYISHALGDVQSICDKIVVLRDGRVVGQGDSTEFNTQRLVSLMVGRDCDQQFPAHRSEPSSDVLLKVDGASQPGVIHDVSFCLHRGEVLGISGLMGSGRTELARILFGLDAMASGKIELEGRSIDKFTTRKRIALGLAMLTESRRDDGLCMQASIQENMGLVAAPKFSLQPWGVLQLKKLHQAIKLLCHAIRLTPSVELRQPVRILSGGNQQKVVFGKWLLDKPKVLLLDEPTRGIDVGAKFEIYGLIDQLANEGAGVLVISSELEELIGICDRILVIRQGEIQDVVHRNEFDRERIMHAALNADLGTKVQA